MHSKQTELSATLNWHKSSGLTSIQSVIFPVLLWVGFIMICYQEWSHNPQYSFGWITPLLTAYLIYQRLEDLPAPKAAKQPPLWLFVLLCASIMILYPVQVLFLANPDWRPLPWVYALIAYAVSCMVLWQNGGKSWLIHFAPPLVLMLFAVPWPMRIEAPITHGLMTLVASTVVEILNFSGIYAERFGNLIRLRSGWVGVEEACSGVRSLQSTLMSAWFIGELFRFSIAGRLLLLVCGAIVSLVLNTIRTLILTWSTHAGGTDLLTSLHDPIGHVVAVLAFAILLMLAYLVNRSQSRPHATAAKLAASRRVPVHGQSLPPWYTLTLIALWCGSFVFAWGWYYRSEYDYPPERPLVLSWDPAPVSLRFVEISPAIRSALRYTEGLQAEWFDSDATRWIVFQFAWAKGTVSSAVGGHRPDICLPNSGFSLTETHPPLEIKIDDHTIEFAASTYRFEKEYIQVFYATWEDHWQSQAPIIESISDRLYNAWRGKRILSRRSLQIVLRNSADSQIAREKVADFLEQHLHWRPD